jgi:PST family polysaccharide transporter
VAPTIVRVFFDARWAGMASILTVLSVMTVFQPVPWSAIAYLQAEKMTRLIMFMSIVRTAMLLALVALLGWLGGPVWACAGVGVAYAFHSLLAVVLTARVTALQARPYFVNVLRPLLACIPMFVAVTALRFLLARWSTPPALSLTAEIVCGALAYVGSAFVLAGANVRELHRLARPHAEDPVPAPAPAPAPAAGAEDV